MNTMRIDRGGRERDLVPSINSLGSIHGGIQYTKEAIVKLQKRREELSSWMHIIVPRIHNRQEHILELVSSLKAMPGKAPSRARELTESKIAQLSSERKVLVDRLQGLSESQTGPRKAILAGISRIDSQIAGASKSAWRALHADYRDQRHALKREIESCQERCNKNAEMYREFTQLGNEIRYQQTSLAQMEREYAYRLKYLQHRKLIPTLMGVSVILQQQHRELKQLSAYEASQLFDRMLHYPEHDQSLTTAQKKPSQPLGEIIK